MKRHIQDFNRFSVNESGSVNEAIDQGPFTCGVAYIQGDYGLNDAVKIYSTLEEAKASLTRMLLEMMEDGEDFDQGIAFVAKQEMGGHLMKIDSSGGGYGEIIVSGSGKKLFVEDLEQGIEEVIEKLRSL